MTDFMLISCLLIGADGVLSLPKMLLFGELTFPLHDPEFYNHLINPLVSRCTCMYRALGDYDILMRNISLRTSFIKCYNLGLQVEMG